MKIKFLISGIFNTLFALIFTNYFYYYFNDLLGLKLILLINNIVPITFTFIMHKYYVFKSNGNFFSEYIKTIINYSILGIFNFIILFYLINELNVNFYILNFFFIVLLVPVSYMMQKKITFKF